MTPDLLDYWNIDHGKRNIENSESTYAISKEKLFPRNSYILDLGGGRGADSVYFIKKGHKVTLVDISDIALNMAIERARKEKVEIETKRISLGNNEELPFTKNTFDIVYSRLALHYFNAQDTATIFKNIYEILKHTGTAYITLKSLNDTEEMDFLKGSSIQLDDNVFEVDGMLKSRFSKDQLEKLLLKVGIENYEINEIDENLDNKSGPIRSGNSKFILNEIIFKKD